MNYGAPVIPELRKGGQKDHKFGALLNYIARPYLREKDLILVIDL